MAQLTDMPGDLGLPVIGHTLRMIRDAERWAREGLAEYGPVFRAHFLFEPWVIVAIPDDARAILLDREKVFSSEGGWDSTIGKLFARGLMLRDFDDHRYHRRVMQEAFRAEPMRGYVDAMRPIVASTVAGWEPDSTISFYPAMKQLTLDIASRVFVGIPLGDEADQLNRDFVRAVAASVAPIRREVPGSAFRRGMRSRRRLEAFFRERIPERRRSDATDLFTRLCHAESEDGGRFDDQEIVDHMIFLLMAAHDTTTSTLATMAWELARRPDWQRRLRNEAEALGPGGVTWEARGTMVETEWVFQEAMRMHPPVPFIPRRTVGATQVAGYELPPGTAVSVSPLLIHRLPALWTAPDEFDPERFSPGRREDRSHSNAFFPFSGGAHTCIGKHFASVMTKAIVAEVLTRYRLVAAPGQTTHIQTLPIPKPRGGLPLRLERVA